MPKGTYERKQCRNGHPYEEGQKKRCMICAKAKYQRYRDRWPEKVRAVEKTYRETHQESRKALWAAWYETKGREDGKARRAHNKQVLIDLMGGKCVRCGYSDNPVGLQFDHINPKEKSAALSNLLARATISVDELLDEAKKCQLLCATCHQIKTHRPEDF